MKNPKRKRGFTLAEVLITIVIISVGIVAVTRSFNKGLRAYTDIENVDLALNIAQTEMEEIRNTAFDDIIDKEAAADADFPNFTVVRDVADESEDLKEVDITVSWAVAGGSANVRLTTLVTD